MRPMARITYGRGESWETVRGDVRFALRTLGRNPGFTAIAVLTLALGIGANSAIFSIVNGVLLRSLPFPHPERLVRAYQNNSTASSTSPGPISAINLDDWRARSRLLTDIGGYWFSDGQSGTDLTGNREPQRLSATFIAPGFWNTLGVPAALGRVQRDNEMIRGSDDRRVVLSHAFFVRQFGADPTKIGSRITLGGESYEITGVMPRSFTFPSPRVDVYVPFSTIPDNAIPRRRAVRVLSMVARMKAGVTPAQAGAELDGIMRALAAEYPNDNAGAAGASVVPLQDAIVGNVRTSLLILFGAVSFVLLIASVNLASLLLARASARESELAVRAALGASRGRIATQLFVESMVLAGFGGVLGIGVAALGARLLLKLGADQLPSAESVSLDPRVVAFTAVITILTGLVFGLVPAIRASRPELQHALREGSRGVARGAGALRGGLVIAEIALAMMLVTGAGLMVRSFVNLSRVDLGFVRDHRIAVNFTLSSARHPANNETHGVYEAILNRVRQTPGVLAAGAVRDLPFRGNGETMPLLAPGMTPGPDGHLPTATLMFTSDGYFKAMGMPIIAGRDLSSTDREDAPTVLVVNQAFAKKFFGGRNPVGQSVVAGANPATGEPDEIRIVGLVGDTRQQSVDETPEPRVYGSVLQTFRVKVNLVVHTLEDPATMTKRVVDAIHSVEPLQTITATFTLDDAVRGAIARPRLLTVLLGVFGGMGLVLGALGLYGVLAYLVAQRTREIGVRVALGATSTEVLRMIVGNGLALAAVGIAVGLVGALALSRMMTSVLYDVAPTDPITLAGVAAVLFGTAALASWIPARRASRVDPLVALRAD